MSWRGGMEVKMRRRTRSPSYELFALFLCLTIVAGCAGRRGPAVAPAPPPAPPPAAASAPPAEEPACPPCVDPASPKVVAAYAAAIEAAKYPARNKISRDLVPLLRTNEDLVWKEGKFLMATWTKARYYSDTGKYHRGAPFALYGDTWFTAVPLVREFCQALGLDGAMLTLRLEQLIGLPPEAGSDVFLEVWVDPTDLFRPCPDPEIGDHECMVEIPVVDRNDQRPWDCTLREQVSGKFVTVHPTHLQWMCDNWTSSYDSEDPLENYPWTALGYTYDWGNPDDPVGMSEYVALGGSEVVFHSLTPTEIYCSK